MKNEKFSIQISNYSMTPHLPKGITCRHDEFKELLMKNSINFSDVHDENDPMTWVSMPDLKVGTQDVGITQNNFDRCGGRYCNMLCNGIIVQCTHATYILRNMELIEEIKKELVDIRTSTNLRRDLIRFYCRPYSAFCHYCHFDSRQTGLLRGEQLDAQSAPDLPQDRGHDA